MQSENLTVCIDPEIQSYIESLVSPESLPRVLEDLAAMDQDELLTLYLSDGLESWISSRKSEVKKPTITPEKSGPTMADIRAYINRRYERWLDYSKFNCTLNKLYDQSGDLLNEVLIMVLVKEESFLIKLFSQKKQGYTGLDFYILSLIKMNSHSLTSPYRYKYRTLLRDANAAPLMEDFNNDEDDQIFNKSQQLHDEFADNENSDTDPIDEEYSESDPNELMLTRFQIVRDVIEQAKGFTSLEKKVFYFRFFLDSPWKEWKGKEKPRVLNAIYKKVQDYVIQSVAKRREAHNLSTIHELFTRAKYIPIRVNESEFLMLREYLSRQKELNEDLIAISSEDQSPANEARISELFKQGTVIGNFEKKILLTLESELKTNDINTKF